MQLLEAKHIRQKLLYMAAFSLSLHNLVTNQPLTRHLFLFSILHLKMLMFVSFKAFNNFTIFCVNDFYLHKHVNVRDDRCLKPLNLCRCHYFTYFSTFYLTAIFLRFYLCCLQTHRNGVVLNCGGTLRRKGCSWQRQLIKLNTKI